jgi:hypothetical protein
MAEIGIPCNKRGVSLGMQEPFVSFLRALGVEAEARPFRQDAQEEDSQATSRTRLKPWACRCTRVWASVRVEVEAFCFNCSHPFQRQ